MLQPNLAGTTANISSSLGLDSSLAVRKELAANGGNVPADLLH
jgi:hypothetical protein